MVKMNEIEGTHYANKVFDICLPKSLAINMHNHMLRYYYVIFSKKWDTTSLTLRLDLPKTQFLFVVLIFS